MEARRETRQGGLRGTFYAGPHALVGAPVTRAIVWIDVAIFVAQLVLARSPGALSEMPTYVSVLFGGNVPELTLHAGHWDNLLTHAFLHGSLLHIVFNLYALRQVGPLVERPVGSARYAVLYVLTAIAGGLASSLSADARGNGDIVSVGASGAICGVMGAAIVTWIRVEGWRSSIAWQIGFWLAVTIVLGASTKGIDNAAHVGGFVAGCVVAITWKRGVPDTSLKRALLIGGSALLCVAAFARTTWRDVTDPYAYATARARANAVARAISAGDCDDAARALRAAEALPPSDAELRGLRAAFSEVCSRGNSRR